MGALFGPLGGLDELPCASELAESPEGSAVVKTTAALSGTVRAQLSPVLPPRVWQVGVGSRTPGEAAILYRAAQAQHAAGRPWVFYSEAAQVQNVLDPEAALMSPHRWTNLTPVGSRVQPYESAHPRYLSSGATPLDGSWARVSNIPVPHHRTVTVSVTVTARSGETGHLWIDELRMDGTTLSVRKLSTKKVEDRLTATFTTSGETVALTLGVARADIVVDPQITLTDAAPDDWMPGGGCLNALIVEPSQTVQLAIPGVPWGARSGYEWQVIEVGSRRMGHAG